MLHQRYLEQTGVRIAKPFTRLEKFSLWALVAAFIAPYGTWDGKLFLTTEIAMMVFVAVAHWRVKNLARPFHLLAVLAVPLAFAFRYPPASGFSFLVSSLVYAKLVAFVFFVYILVERCRNTGNIVWLGKNVILPVALVLCLSALVDRYTDLPFFVKWHQHVTVATNMLRPETVGTFIDPEVLDRLLGVSRHAGFATRSSDIPPWALLGLATAYWLWRSGLMRRVTFLGIFLALIAASFSMPKRSAVVTIGTAVLAFLLFARTRFDQRRKMGLVILMAIIAISSDWLAVFYQRTHLELDPTTAGKLGSISRLMNFWLTEDMRYRMLPLEIEWFLSNPRELFLGTGWNLTGGFWAKPHNSYIGMIVGGGLLSLVVILVALTRLLRRLPVEHRQRPPGVMGIILLVSLCVEVGISGYLSGRLDFVASTLTIWIAYSAILYKNTGAPVGITGSGPVRPSIMAAQKDLLIPHKLPS